MKKSRWKLPSKRSRGGRGDVPSPHPSASQNCKYLYFLCKLAFCIGCYYLLNLSLNALDRHPPKASTRAAGKRPAASKRRQAIFPLSDDEAEDADIFRLVPRKGRKQVGPSEQGGSSVPAVVTAPTTATQSTDEGNMPHHTPTPVPEVEQVPVETAEQAEQGRSRRRSFATSFRKSKL